MICMSFLLATLALPLEARTTLKVEPYPEIIGHFCLVDRIPNSAIKWRMLPPFLAVDKWLIVEIGQKCLDARYQGW
jgi:hypothetical protein